MIQPAVYTVTSPLHDEDSVREMSSAFIGGIEELLGYKFDFKGADFSDYGSVPLNLIFVRTGGTEGVFKSEMSHIEGPVYLLTSGKSNSLAASMEILSYLRQQGRVGEIIHGSLDFIAERISSLVTVTEISAKLAGKRFGVIGKPSDWLISSAADVSIVRAKLGIELVDIPMDELLKEIAKKEYPVDIAGSIMPLEGNCPSGKVSEKMLEGALEIYGALKRIVERYCLSGLTLRCFDLLGPVGNTGCLALSILNRDGVVAGCEGDVPVMLSMAIAQALTGCSGFQANPSRIDVCSREILFAHCTIPLDMLDGYDYNTHFESGIGVAIHGNVEPGPVTVFKISGNLADYFLCEGHLDRCYGEDGLCRTQLHLGMNDDISSLLTSPVGNHHVVMRGHHAAEIRLFVESLIKGRA